MQTIKNRAFADSVYPDQTPFLRCLIRICAICHVRHMLGNGGMNQDIIHLANGCLTVKGALRADNALPKLELDIRIGVPPKFCMHHQETFRTGLKLPHSFGSNVYPNALLRICRAFSGLLYRGRISAPFTIENSSFFPNTMSVFLK